MTADEQGYNGWKNYETWAMGLYLGGNYDGEGTYLEVLEQVASALADDIDEHNIAEGIWTREQAETFAVEDRLKAWCDDQIFGEDGDAITGIACDLLRAAFSEVDWRELADHKIVEVRENATI